MYKYLQNNTLKFIFVLSIILCCMPSIAKAQTQKNAALVANLSPLNPDRQDILDLEVPEGTTYLKARSFVYNRTEKRHIPKELVTTHINNAGMISEYKKKSLENSGEFETENRFYDNQNRLIKKETLFVTEKDTISQSVKITYTNGNPLVAKWETDTEIFYEKMYFDKQGIVTKREQMESLEDKNTIYTLETYDPITQKGTYTGFYPEGGEEKFDISYQNGRMLTEVALGKDSDFKKQRFYYNEKGHLTKTNKQYAENQSEISYLQKKLFYQDNVWLASIGIIDFDANLEKNELGFTLREITNANGVIKPTKEIADQVFDEIQQPTKKFM